MNMNFPDFFQWFLVSKKQCKNLDHANDKVWISKVAICEVNTNNVTCFQSVFRNLKIGMSVTQFTSSFLNSKAGTRPGVYDQEFYYLELLRRQLYGSLSGATAKISKLLRFGFHIEPKQSPL